MNVAHSRRFLEIAGGMLVLAVFVLPVFVWAGNTKKIFVDDSNTGVQDGTVAHPFRTISEALNRAHDDDEVHVASGTYRENIEIPKGVELFGEDEDDTVIIAANDNKSAVVMKHKTTIDKFTVKGGRDGIFVEKDARASIIHCIVKDNDRDGIHVREADVDEKRKVSIVKSEIEDNDRKGIFSEKRRIVLIESDVHGNGNDGADLARGSKAFLDDNVFRNNDGSGLKIALDRSSVFVASGNAFRRNGHSGIEVNAHGKPGTVSINRSKFVDNDDYGIARINRVAVPASIWKGLTNAGNTFSSNGKGELSPILNIR